VKADLIRAAPPGGCILLPRRVRARPSEVSRLARDHPSLTQIMGMTSGVSLLKIAT